MNNEIIKQVELICIEEFEVDAKDYYSHNKSNKWKYVHPSYCAMKAIAENTKAFSLAQIGANIRGKDHATVIHAKRKIQDFCDTDKGFAEIYRRIVAKALPILSQKIRCYIAGSIEANTRKLGRIAAEKLFSDAENKLIADGFDPVNPCKLFTEYEKTIFDNIDFMERLIPILFGCQAIYMLTDYIESYNAQIELIIAKNMGLKIMFEN